MKIDLYQRITDQVIAAIAAGTDEFRMPWHRLQGTGTPINAITGRAYRGINTLLLWAEAEQAGFSSGHWATYRQWTQQGAQVRKGEKSTPVVLWKPLNCARDEGDNGDEPQRGRMLARAFHVFNADQVDGYKIAAPPQLPTSARIERAEVFFLAQPATIWNGSDRAFYDPRADIVSMPSFEAFVSSAAYYSVLAHELCHWTGAKQRLDRDLAGRFGSEAYAMEELIAELGAAFTVGHLNLACEPRTDHAPYISSWLRELDGDPRAIITAAGRAQAAADYLINKAQETADRATASPAKTIGLAA